MEFLAGIAVGIVIGMLLVYMPNSDVLDEKWNGDDKDE